MWHFHVGWNHTLILHSGCVVECRICNWEVVGSNLSLRYFAPRSAQPSIPPGSVKWVPVIAGKAQAGMAYSDCGWTCGCAGKTVKSLENTRHTWALLRRWFTTKRRYIKVRVCTFTFLPLHIFKGSRFTTPDLPPRPSLDTRGRTGDRKLSLTTLRD